MNQDMISCAKTVLESLKDLRPESEALNAKFIKAMAQEDNISAVRELFPEIVSSAAKTSDIISTAFVSIDWSAEGNTADRFYDIFRGVDVPEELRGDVDKFLMENQASEKEMVGLFGENPMTSALDRLDLLGELEELVQEMNSVRVMQAVLAEVPGMPVAQE